MGSVVGKAMDDNMKKQQDFMLETQRLMVITDIIGFRSDIYHSIYQE